MMNIMEGIWKLIFCILETCVKLSKCGRSTGWEAAYVSYRANREMAHCRVKTIQKLIGNLVIYTKILALWRLKGTL